MSRLLTAALVALSMAAPLAAQLPRTIGTNVVAATPEKIREATDRILFERLYLKREEWPRLPTPNSVRPDDTSDLAVLIAAGNSQDASLRYEYIHALSRIGIPADLPLFVYPVLNDVSEGVRAEAANAIAMILRDRKMPGVTEGAPDAVFILEDRVRREGRYSQIGVQTMLEVLGEIADDKSAKYVESFLINETKVTYPPPASFLARQNAALQGLEAMTRHAPNRAIGGETRISLRRMSTKGLGFSDERGPHLPALQSLVNVRDNDVQTIRSVATYHCVSRRTDCGWEVRRLGLQMMTDAQPAFLDAIHQGTQDRSFRVRIEAYRVLARSIPQTHVCAPLFDAWADPEPAVVLFGIKLLDARCTSEREAITARLKEWANDLGDETKDQHWKTPAAALEALVPFSPADAVKIAREMALTHKVWNVRAAGARVAGALADESLAMEFARDDEPNVRAEVLNALVRMQSPKVGPVAVAALDSNNYQLVYLAAASLTPAVDRKSAAPSLVEALKRLTDIGDDTSREARLALIERVQQVGSPDDDTLSLLAKLAYGDPDPPVAMAAAATYQALTGSATTVIRQKPEIRKPLPRDSCVDVLMTGGQQFSIAVNHSLAPYVADRFLDLVAQGFYEGLTFHRLIHDGFAEGGSPAANYFTGADERHVQGVGPERFFRDDITSQRHERGTVAMSRHDLNTVSSQFFIDFLDSPHLNREFTVIGRVTWCEKARLDDPMDTVDQLMEGDRIASIRIHHGVPRPLP